MKARKILTGIDLGQDTEKILAYGAFFAEATGASLDLLYVLDFLITPPTYLATYMEEEKRAAEERFRPWQETLSARGIKTTTEVVVGRLHESFVTVMRKSAVDLVTLGFRSHAFRWSSSERLIKGLSVPMLVVRGERAEKARIGSVEIRKILCPTDFSDMSRKALDVAQELQHLFSSDLDVIHSVPSHFIRERLAGDTEAAAEVETQARRDLDALTAQAGIAKQGVMREGEPYREIASFSAEHDIDLIVMGARGLSYVEGFIIGSVTDAVLRSSPCPVLVVH